MRHTERIEKRNCEDRRIWPFHKCSRWRPRSISLSSCAVHSSLSKFCVYPPSSQFLGQSEKFAANGAKKGGQKLRAPRIRANGWGAQLLFRRTRRGPHWEEEEDSLCRSFIAVKMWNGAGKIVWELKLFFLFVSLYCFGAMLAMGWDWGLQTVFRSIAYKAKSEPFIIADTVKQPWSPFLSLFQQWGADMK